MDGGLPHLDSSAELPRAATRYWYGSLGFSAVVHVCAIAALAGIWMHSEGGSSVTVVDTRWSAEETDSRFDRIDQVQQTAPASEVNVGGAQPAPVMLDSARHRPMPVAAPSTLASVSANSLGSKWTSDDLVEEAGAVFGRLGDAAAIGNGDGSGSGAGSGNGGSFFGSRASGRRFVYVVDCSGSMNHPHRSEAKTRFRRLKIELIRSITDMSPDMQFFIVFFNHRTHPMPARTLQAAVPEKQKRHLRWAAQIRAQGNTDPREALFFAMRLNPDVIYFLTDGDFDRPIRRDLEKLKQDRAAIHTFAFGNRSAEFFLKNLALANGGEYHFIP